MQALIVAQLDPVNYGKIQNAVAGVIFLGTPHCGSSVASIPALLTKVANVALSGTSRWTGGMRDDLLDSLKRESGQLHDISKDFVGRLSGLHIVSCIEMNSTPPLKEVVRSFSFVTSVHAIAAFSKECVVERQRRKKRRQSNGNQDG
jgi:hypothetical protein